MLLALIFLSPVVQQRYPRYKKIYTVLLVCLAIGILQYEISLYHPRRLLALKNDFSPDFVISSLQKVVQQIPAYTLSLKVLGLSAIILTLTYLFDISPITYGTMAVMVIGFGPQSLRAEQFYRDFLQEQRELRTSEEVLAKKSVTPKKVVFFHICSISNDDMGLTNLKRSPFWGQFDWVTWQFLSATSYSDHATIRAMKSLCGQVDTSSLLQDHRDDDACSVMNYLAKQNIQVTSLYDHTGKAMGFLEKIEKRTKLPSPIFPENIPTNNYNFDGSSIYREALIMDFALEILKNNARQFIYYNAIILHNGLNFPRTETLLSDLDLYLYQFGNLTQAFSTFVKNAEEKGLPLLIVVVGDHGYPLSQNWPQVGNLRDIPTQEVSKVPLAIKLVGLPAQGKSTSFSENQISYFQLGQVLTRYLSEDKSPWKNREDLQRELNGLEETKFVSESDQWLVVEREGKYFFRNKKGLIWWKLA